MTIFFFYFFNDFFVLSKAEKFLQLQKRSSDNSKEYDNDGKKQWKESIKSDLERNLKINQFIHDEKNGEAGKSNAS